MKVNATAYFEVGMAVSGTFTPGYCQTLTDPGEPDAMEDLEITGLAVMVRDTQSGHTRWRDIDVMDGVDIQSPDVQRLLANILALPYVSEMVDDALLGEVVDGQ